MSGAVSVTLPSGTKVTCSKELAERLGAAESKAPAKKATSEKSKK